MGMGYVITRYKLTTSNEQLTTNYSPENNHVIMYGPTWV